MKEIDLTALGKLAMKDSKKKTFVRFYNSKEDVFITIPMDYEPFDPDLHQKGEIGVDQRIEAYEKLSHYVTDEFMHNTAVYEAIVADRDNKIYEVVKNNVYMGI